MPAGLFIYTESPFSHTSLPAYFLLCGLDLDGGWNGAIFRIHHSTAQSGHELKLPKTEITAMDKVRSQ